MDVIMGDIGLEFKSVRCLVEIVGQVGRGPCDLYACQISKA